VLTTLEWTPFEQYAASFRKMQLVRRTYLKGKITKENWFCFNQNKE